MTHTPSNTADTVAPDMQDPQNYGPPVPRENGTKDFADWQMAGPVLRVSDVSPGDFIFKDSKQFSALNLAVVTTVNTERGNFYARFVNPANPTVGRIGCGQEDEFCTWDFELSRNSLGDSVLKAVNAARA